MSVEMCCYCLTKHWSSHESVVLTFTLLMSIKSLVVQNERCRKKNNPARADPGGDTGGTSLN